jgi:4'-phosphopantetheinyl transferase
MSPPLDPRRIEVWCAWLDDIDAARRWEDYRALLDAPERERQGRLRVAADRRRDLAARALVRTVLSRHVPIPPGAWVFGADANGRPRIVAPQPLPPIEFNIAHSGDLVVLAVATGRALGVDVEDTGRRTDTVALERYFAPREREALIALPPAVRRQRFFELWTLKESYLKARGVGLRLPLRGVAFEFGAPAAVQLSFTGVFVDDAARWALAQLTLRGHYTLAVCAERHGREALRLAVQETVPLAWARPLRPTLACASAIVAEHGAADASLGG